MSKFRFPLPSVLGMLEPRPDSDDLLQALAVRSLRYC